MAEEQEIDKLSLSIEISDKTQEGSEVKLKNLAKAVRSLNNAISKTDISKIDNFFSAMSKSITPLAKSIEKVSGSFEALGNIAKIGGLEKVSEQLQDIKIKTEEINEATQKAVQNPKAQNGDSQKTNIEDDLSKSDDNIRDITEKYDLLQAKLENIRTRMQDNNLKEEKLLSLKGQELTIISQIKAIEDKQEKARQAEISAKSVRDMGEISGKAELLQKKLEYIRNLMKSQNLTEKQFLSLKNQELTIMGQLSGKQEDTAVKQSKLLKSVTRVAIYRAIRAGLKEITQSISQSLDAIAMFDKGFRGTMSNITSSLTQLKASVGIVLYQGLIILEPIITAISSTFVGFANAISYVTASIRGQNTYLKINTDYWKEYQSAMQGTLLSFDTFTTLSSSGAFDYSKMFVEADVGASSLADNLKEVNGLIAGLTAALIALGASKVFNTLFTVTGLSKIIDGSKSISAIFKSFPNTFMEWSKTWGSFKGLVLSTSILIAGIVDMIASWKNPDFTGWEKAITIIAAVASAAAAAAIAVNTLKLGIKGAFAAAAAIGGATLLLGTELAKATKVKAYANGGMFDGSGTMYALAGERGAEVVAKGSNGTGVLNVQQFTEAMLNALTIYGAAKGNVGGDVYFDSNKVGKVVASSSGFRDEISRRNNGIILK